MNKYEREAEKRYPLFIDMTLSERQAYLAACRVREKEIERLKDALEYLLEAIPKQTVDADWWEDDLTNAVEKAREAIFQTKQ